LNDISKLVAGAFFGWLLRVGYEVCKAKQISKKNEVLALAVIIYNIEMILRLKGALKCYVDSKGKEHMDLFTGPRSALLSMADNIVRDFQIVATLRDKELFRDILDIRHALESLRVVAHPRANHRAMDDAINVATQFLSLLSRIDVLAAKYKVDPKLPVLEEDSE
jgi:hypothetical protein